jgi:(p)ppGpp synthase/HD superfamily hydrolase
MKDNFEFALEFAISKHRGQVDKGWTPYIQHILGVWSRLRDADLTTQIAALLHDVVEDTATTITEIDDKFGAKVASIVAVLTHMKSEPYDSYIIRIAMSENRSAILIKLADLADNSSPERLKRLPKDAQAYFQNRIETKYKKAQQTLNAALADIVIKEL